MDSTSFTSSSFDSLQVFIVCNTHLTFQITKDGANRPFTIEVDTGCIIITTMGFAASTSSSFTAKEWWWFSSWVDPSK